MDKGNDSRNPPEGGHGTASASLLTLQPSSGAAAAECRGNLVIMAPGTREGGLAQLARAPALQAGGQRFESVILHTKERTLTYWKAVRRGAKPLAQANQTDTTRNLNQESNRHKRGEPARDSERVDSRRPSRKEGMAAMTPPEDRTDVRNA